MTESSIAGPADAHPEDRGKTRRRAWSLYSWSSRARWLKALFASRADAIASLGALALIGGVATTTVTEAVMNHDLRGAARAERLGDNATTYGIEGRDAAGRRAAFDLVVLDKRFDWVRGSTTELQKDGEVIPAADIARTVLNEPVRLRLAQAVEIIAVGTASSEGDVETETHRAGQRAQQTASWVADAVPASIPVHTLNFGQYRNPCADCETADTSWQRPFMVVAVREKEPGTDIAEALAAAMQGKSNLPSVAAYSSFGFAKFR